MLWGSDFPFAVWGGHEETPHAVPYRDVVSTFLAHQEWIDVFTSHSTDALDDIMYNNAARLFRFASMKSTTDGAALPEKSEL